VAAAVVTLEVRAVACSGWTFVIRSSLASANSRAIRSSIVLTFRVASSRPNARHSVLWSGARDMPMPASHCGESLRTASALR
jgi:hypothetical protein